VERRGGSGKDLSLASLYLAARTAGKLVFADAICATPPLTYSVDRCLFDRYADWVL